jgi:hypothetical protein
MGSKALEYEVWVKVTTFGPVEYVCGMHATGPLTWILGVGATAKDAFNDWQDRVQQWLRLHTEFTCWPPPLRSPKEIQQTWVSTFKWSP